MEEHYEQLAAFRQDEKALRLRVNQLEVELEHQLKRLDIICKSKGLPRPQVKKAAGSGYVSPYRQGGSQTRPAQRGNASATRSNSGTRPSPFRANFQFTPPGRKREMSPSGFSQGSAKFKNPGVSSLR